MRASLISIILAFGAVAWLLGGPMVAALSVATMGAGVLCWLLLNPPGLASDAEIRQAVADLQRAAYARRGAPEGTMRAAVYQAALARVLSLNVGKR